HRKVLLKIELELAKDISFLGGCLKSKDVAFRGIRTRIYDLHPGLVVDIVVDPGDVERFFFAVGSVWTVPSEQPGVEVTHFSAVCLVYVLSHGVVSTLTNKDADRVPPGRENGPVGAHANDLLIAKYHRRNILNIP